MGRIASKKIPKFISVNFGDDGIMVLTISEMKQLRSRRRRRMKAREKEVCPYCKYEWKPKVLDPKSCPRCKKRLDMSEELSTFVEAQEQEKLEVYKI